MKIDLSKRPMCIFHKNCLDGIGAAAVVKDAIPIDNIIMHGGIYNQPPPLVLNRQVIMVDFSYPLSDIQKMASAAKEILILDHHATAKEALADKASELPDNVEVVFDMERSGAGIAWEYFYPGKEMPWVIKHIQDRDLWLWELENTREITMALNYFKGDFVKLLYYSKEMLYEKFLEHGKLLVEAWDSQIAKLSKKFALRQTKLADTNDVIIVNAPLFYASDLGDRLGQFYSIVAVYQFIGDDICFSLRSKPRKGGNVRKIAEYYGGGGHEHSAGFSIPIKSDTAKEIFAKSMLVSL